MQTQEEKYNKRKVNSAYITTMISIMLVLFTLGFLGILVIYTKTLSNYIKENIGFEIIIKPGVKEAEILRLEKNLDIKNYVKSTEYITKKEAVKRLKKALGPDFVDFWGTKDNPLLPSIDIRFKAQWANNDSINIIKKEILQNPYVKEVYYQKSLVDVINKNLNKIGLVLLVLSLILLIISITLINNTIRLSVYSKRFTLRSMELVGATPRFIRAPFVLKGVLYGIYSALLALLLLTGVLILARNNIPEIRLIENDQLIGGLYLFIVFIGIAVSGISTRFAVDRYLGISKNKFYF